MTWSTQSKRRMVVVLRKRGGYKVRPSYVSGQGADFVREQIAPGMVVSANEGPRWDFLASDFDMQRINYSKSYSMNGAHMDGAESYFSRLRRMIGGQHLRVEGRYLNAYATHAAWLEDHRGESNGCRCSRSAGRTF